MKKIIYYFLLFLFSIPSFAENNANISPEQATLIHNELRTLRDTMQRAMNEQDIEALLANTDENIVFSTMNGDVIHGRENLRAYYKKMLKGDDRVVDSMAINFVADDLSILHDKDLAIATGHSDGLYELAVGEKFNVKAIWSATIINRDGAWKIASFHYSVNMFDNPILDVQQKIIWIIGICGIFLAFITFLFGRHFKRSAQ